MGLFEVFGSAGPARDPRDEPLSRRALMLPWVFFIIVLIVMVIKILLMFPGLLDCSDDDEESDENEIQTV